MTDGNDPKYIEAVLQSLITADDYTGAELLNRLLLLEGILAIQRGESPSQIAMRLGAMLGEKYLPRVLELGRENSTPAYFEMMRVISSKTAEPTSEPFEERLLPLPNRTLQTILRNTDLADWEKALRGCGSEMINKVLDNVSQTMALRFCEAIADTTESLSAEIMRTQSRILEAVERLENTGEIII